MIPYEQYQQSYTRQLAWSLFSPDLFIDWRSPIQPDDWTLQWLQTIDQSPAPESKQRRLGFLFEDLLAHYFTAHPDWQLLARNLPVREQGHTLGELDFIVHHLPSDEILHIECTVKFYLRFQDTWFGPNAKDRLDRKFDRMIKHQLPLIHHPATLKTLASKNIHQQPASAIHARAWLFEPSNAPAWPDWLNPAVDRGRWYYRNDDSSTVTEKNAVYLPKRFWLDPEATRLKHSCSNSAPDRPQMLGWNRNRWFLVPESWPALDNRESITNL